MAVMRMLIRFPKHQHNLYQYMTYHESVFNVPFYGWFETKGVDVNNLWVAYGLLAVAIISEVIGSTFLVKSEGFSKLFPSIMVVILFSLAFYLLSQVIKIIPLGIAYAIWAGVGIVLTAMVGYVLFKQTLDAPAIIGIVLIVSGVVVINLFSQSTGH